MNDIEENNKELFKKYAEEGRGLEPGRKPKEFYVHDRVAEDKIQEAASKGLTKGQIAARIGFSPAKLYKSLKADEKIAQAVERGRGKLNEEAMGYIIDAMRGGDLRAACFIVSHLDKMAAREEQQALRTALENTESGQTLIEMLIASKSEA